MVNKKLIRVPDGIIRGNVTFVERRKTNSKYNVKFSEKIAAVFNIKFPAFMLEMETIDPDCSVARARAIWQMRSHFIKEIPPMKEAVEIFDEIDDEDYSDDDEENEMTMNNLIAIRKVAGSRRVKLYKVSRRLIRKDLEKLRDDLNKVLDRLNRE